MKRLKSYSLKMQQFGKNSLQKIHEAQSMPIQVTYMLTSILGFAQAWKMKMNGWRA